MERGGLRVRGDPLPQQVRDGFTDDDEEEDDAFSSSYSSSSSGQSTPGGMVRGAAGTSQKVSNDTPVLDNELFEYIQPCGGLTFREPSYITAIAP